MLQHSFAGRGLRALALAILLCGCGQAPPAAIAAGDTGVPESRAATFTATAVRHFFVIVLENKGYDRSFGPGAGSAYLAQTLPTMGLLLRQYYGTGHASLDNYITMVSGQPPNILTQADCPLFLNFLPGVADPLAPGIFIGQGCVYPKKTVTIADQLEGAGFSWKGYMQDLDDGVTHTCRHPAINRADMTESATAANQYATRHNPFMYFHSIIDNQARCDAHVVDLAALDNDLLSAATTPNYSFITPDLCADGHDGACADGVSPGGYDGIDAFLRVWVPKILNSAAFQQDGLLLVTFDESDGNATDGNDACCNEPTGPNTTAPGAGNVGVPGVLTYKGGGRVGGVVISPFTMAGTISDVPYNHYSMLRSVENMFGLEHAGYAAQAGLVPFGADVYNNGVIPAGTGG